MRPETANKLERIKRSSAAIQKVCKLFLVLTALAFLAGSAGILTGKGVSIRTFDVVIPVGPLDTTARAGLLVLLALSTAVAAKVLYHLERLFALFAEGIFFAIRTAAQLKQLGVATILGAGVEILWTVASIALTNAPGQHPIPLHLDTLFIGAAVITVSWFMEAAAEIQEENELTI